MLEPTNFSLEAFYLLAFALAHASISGTFIYATYAPMNRVRDAIITGVFQGQALTIEHRKLMLSNDWIPSKFGIGVVLSVLFIVGATPPLLFADVELHVRYAAASTAIIPAGGAMTFLLLGLGDFIFMVRRLSLPMLQK